MKKLKDIPDNFEDLDIGDSETITESDLKQIDGQLENFSLELVVFDNGAALNWYIQTKRER